MTDTLTTAQVAALLGVSPSGVRQLVRRGKLIPVQGGKPHRFRHLDVETARAARMTEREWARFDQAVAEWEQAQGPDTGGGA